PPQFPLLPGTMKLPEAAQQQISSQIEQHYGQHESLNFPLGGPIRWQGKSASVEAVIEETPKLIKAKSPLGDYQSEPATGQTLLVLPQNGQSSAEAEQTPAELARVRIPWTGTVQSLTAEEVEFIPDGTEHTSLQVGDEMVLRPSHQLLAGQGIYRQHCMACHGISGGGDGPQSQILNPKPRDFRLGIFKYTSTVPGLPSSHDDLKKVIKQGIAGTGMPAFKLLGNHEIAQAVDYVRYLALRGVLERDLALEVGVELPLLKTPEETEQFYSLKLPQIVQKETSRQFELCFAADDPARMVQPTSEPPEPGEKSVANPELTSVENGRLLFQSKTGQCATCHGADGKGDGEQTKAFHKGPDGNEYPEPGLHDSWGHLVKPRDLSYGVFHGGREKIDLYRRIYAGVKGTPMPAYALSGLTEQEIWDLVNFVLSLGE
ncbi:MAG: cytochrome c, partial [Planctomycetaceae bacterium]|nr:cytochrome c [Planctomycetaceae bacterium]